MKAYELIDIITDGAYKINGETCDTIKSGDPEKEIKRVGVTMFATVDVIREAMEWGADMLIVHEPTYYDHMENLVESPVIDAKRALIEKSGIVIYRYHDRMHHRPIDQIPEGEIYYMGLKGKMEKTQYSASYTFDCDTPITATELCEIMKNELGIKHLRVAGELNKKATRLALCFGTPGGVYDLLRDESIQIVMTGEACEWMLAEYARDASALGFNKTLIVMGHIPSERDGMRLLAKRLDESMPIEIKYIECGEVYH
ncbi:MAG: Nif3-like dinuclear metal center hexameric protein [Clostridia bacterium]|nr:Nif3-like dinuclear metal center hexameric protein [Clostridia bacterium]